MALLCCAPLVCTVLYKHCSDLSCFCCVLKPKKYETAEVSGACSACPSSPSTVYCCTVVPPLFGMLPGRSADDLPYDHSGNTGITRTGEKVNIYANVPITEKKH